MRSPKYFRMYELRISGIGLLWVFTPGKRHYKRKVSAPWCRPHEKEEHSEKILAYPSGIPGFFRLIMRKNSFAILIGKGGGASIFQGQTYVFFFLSFFLIGMIPFL